MEFMHVVALECVRHGGEMDAANGSVFCLGRVLIYAFKDEAYCEDGMRSPNGCKISRKHVKIKQIISMVL